MITNILLIYLIVMCWYFYGYSKKNSLIINNNAQLITTISVILSFGFLFVIFLRVMSFFRESQRLDLKIIFNYHNSYILFFFFLLIFFYSLRRLLFFLFKFHWFKFHYFMMSQYNLSSFEQYRNFFFNFVYFPAVFSFRYLIYLNYFLTFGLVVVFIYDIIFNNLVLDCSLYYLKYYSFFKVIYFSYKFLLTKQQILLDYYSYNLLYTGVIDENSFHLNKDKQHRNLIGESMNYTSGIIREELDYCPKNKKKINEISYFREILEKKN